MQGEPMPYPEGAGWKRTETSKAAALKIEPMRGTIRRQAWEALAEPMTNEQLARRLGKNLYSVAPRVTELQMDGLVRDSGKRGTTAMGCEAVIWERVSGLEYRDRPKQKVEPRTVIKEWQVELIKTAKAHLALSLDGHALKAEEILKQFLKTIGE